MLLKEYRKRNGMTQEAVAKALGIPTKTYQNYEREVREADPDVLCAIADIYSVSLDELLGRADLHYVPAHANKEELQMSIHLKNVRKRHGLTQAEAANKIGVSLGTYRNWEQGRVSLSLNQLEKAASVFETDISDLLGERESIQSVNYRDTIAENIKLFRKQSGMSVEQLGAMVGVSGKTISAWEVGRGQPDADSLMALCDALDVTVSEMYEPEGVHNNQIRSFFETLAIAMNARGMNMADLSASTGMHPSYFSRLKAGHTKDVTWNRAVKIVSALGMSLDEFRRLQCPQRMTYAEVLGYYLNKCGMKPAELAKRIGSPRSTVNELLKGRAKEPTLGKAKAIADALGVTLQEMADMMYADERSES